MDSDCFTLETEELATFALFLLYMVQLMGEERGTKHGQPSDIVKGFLSIVHEEATIIRKETKLASFTQTKLKQKRGWGLQIKLLFHHGQHSWVTGKDHW